MLRPSRSVRHWPLAVGPSGEAPDDDGSALQSRALEDPPTDDFRSKPDPLPRRQVARVLPQHLLQLLR